MTRCKVTKTESRAVREMKFGSNLFKGLRSLEAEPQAASRRTRNPLLIFAKRKSTKIENKSAVRRRRKLKKANHLVGLFFLFVLVDSRAEHRESKREFRTLRSPTQGSALRTRKPFEKGLSESFNMGAVLSLMPLQ